MKKLILLVFPFLLYSAESYDDLLSLSLEELMEVEVTTVSKKEVNAFKSSSSIFIISKEMIRRSGATSIPELLRLAPGMHVGRISGNQWAVNSRATNAVISREMRLMVDGRDLHNNYNNGIFWDSVSIVLEDIERIEVVRGPGASVWGTNTAHGVINIIMKKASDTEGALVSVSIGDEQDAYVASTRLGFKHENSNGSSRIYAKIRHYDRSTVPIDEESSVGSRTYKDETFDGHHLNTAGFLTDFEPNLDTRIRLNGDLYNGDSENRNLFSTDEVKLKGGNLKFNYDSSLDLYSHISFDAYVDYASRVDSDQNNKMRVIDISLNHIYTRENHSFIWGLEYKNALNDFSHSASSGTLALDPQRRSDDTYSFFLQDDISFFDKSIVVTPAFKYEHNNYTNSEVQPSLRLGYYPTEKVTLWGAFSRSVAAPSRLSVDGYLDLNSFSGFCGVFGGTTDPELGCIIPLSTDDVEESVINTYELGYRQQLFDGRFIMDHAIFYDDYMKKGPDGTSFKELYGYEVDFKLAILESWRTELSYAYHYGSILAGADTNLLENLPKHTISASSLYTYKKDTDFDVLYYFLDKTKNIGSYSRVDVRIEHRPMQNMRLSLVGQNLLESEHTESTFDTTKGNSSVQRAFIGKITLEF